MEITVLKIASIPANDLAKSTLEWLKSYGKLEYKDHYDLGEDIYSIEETIEALSDNRPKLAHSILAELEAIEKAMRIKKCSYFRITYI